MWFSSDLCTAAGLDEVDTLYDHSPPVSRSAQRIARTIVAERVRSIVARNRTRRRRVISSSSEVRRTNLNCVPPLSELTLVKIVTSCCRTWRFPKEMFDLSWVKLDKIGWPKKKQKAEVMAVFLCIVMDVIYNSECHILLSGIPVVLVLLLWKFWRANVNSTCFHTVDWNW